MGRSANRLGFTGHEEDADSGLVYAKARYYDPVLGVFLSPDPAAGDPTQPLSPHPYLYAYANPTTYVDPDGAAARFWYQTFSTDVLDEAARFSRAQFDTLAARGGRAGGLAGTAALGAATLGATALSVVEGTLRTPVTLGEEVGQFAATPSWETLPVLGAQGKALGEGAARFVEEPTLEHGVERVGQLEGRSRRRSRPRPSGWRRWWSTRARSVQRG